MMDREPVFTSALLAPRYWPTWIGFAFWCLLAQLPISLQLKAGAALGRAIKRFAKRRTAIARRNIELCFPNKESCEREKLLNDTMESVGMAFFETGMAWFLSRRRLEKLYTIEGLHHLQEAQARGQGVLLLAMHFTHLDLGGALLCLNHSIDSSYRQNKNPAYDFVQHNRRCRHDKSTRIIVRENVRAMLRSLQQGRTIWYAPDQDYGPLHSVFTPFFGVNTASVTATAKFARLGKAAVIPFTHYRRADGSGYDVRILPPLDGFPSGDDIVDAARVNEVVESCVRECPEQYLWPHRRFKTRPPGEANLYTSKGITLNKRELKELRAQALEASAKKQN